MDLQLVILVEFQIGNTSMKPLVAFSTALLSTGVLFAQKDPATQELRAEIQALEQRVTALEQLLATDKSAAEPKQPQPAPVPLPEAAAIVSTPDKAVDEGKSRSSTVLKGIGNIIAPARKPVAGKWTQLQNWRGIRKGMTSQQVETLLGKPYKAKPSFLKYVDEYWLYLGQNASGENLEGKVRFYKGEVTNWESPGG